jgi:hypothetical protein
MDFLVSVIGNAAVDYEFRERLLKNPVETINAWGLRLTKGEVEMAKAIFGSRTKDLAETFEALEDVLYDNLDHWTEKKCRRPCRMSISQPDPLPTIEPPKAEAA